MASAKADPEGPLKQAKKHKAKYRISNGVIAYGKRHEGATAALIRLSGSSF